MGGTYCPISCECVHGNDGDSADRHQPLNNPQNFGGIIPESLLDQIINELVRDILKDIDLRLKG